MKIQNTYSFKKKKSPFHSEIFASHCIICRFSSKKSEQNLIAISFQADVVTKTSFLFDSRISQITVWFWSWHCSIYPTSATGGGREERKVCTNLIFQ